MWNGQYWKFLQIGKKIWPKDELHINSFDLITQLFFELKNEIAAQQNSCHAMISTTNKYHVCPQNRIVYWKLDHNRNREPSLNLRMKLLYNGYKYLPNIHPIQI